MMAQAAREACFRDIAAAAPEHVDLYLDRYLDYRDRATEWDADQWGFDPDTWMWEHRQEMEGRIAKESA